MGALSHLRVCDFTGQLAGATRLLAAFGAEVIRIEDPVTQGGWDILRGMTPFIDERRGIELGGGFQNHNVEKLGITLNLRTEQGRALLRRLVAISDVAAENFAAALSIAPRPKCMPSCSTTTATSARNARCTASWRRASPSHRGARRRVDPRLRRASRALRARRAPATRPAKRGVDQRAEITVGERR